MGYYLNEKPARDRHPVVFELLDDENRMQAPKAHFVCAAEGHMGDEDIADVVVLYKTETPGALLCAWVANVDEDAYIDEYGELPIDEAFDMLQSVTDDELPESLQSYKESVS
jgi:hypothetical protein